MVCSLLVGQGKMHRRSYRRVRDDDRCPRVLQPSLPPSVFHLDAGEETGAYRRTHHCVPSLARVVILVPVTFCVDVLS